jgi:hypothetical protein
MNAASWSRMSLATGTAGSALASGRMDVGYLVSDYARLGTGEKTVSWRYGWFERWFLDYLLSLSKRTMSLTEIEPGLLTRSEPVLEGVAH